MLTRRTRCDDGWWWDKGKDAAAWLPVMTIQRVPLWVRSLVDWIPTMKKWWILESSRVAYTSPVLQGMDAALQQESTHSNHRTTACLQ